MIEQFFQHAASVEQHRNAPAVGPYLDDVVGQLAALGYARTTVRRYIHACESFGRFLTVHGVELRDLSEAHVEAFLHEIASQRTWRGVPVDAAGAVHGRRRPLALLLARLRSAGVVVECGRWMSRRSIGRVSAALRGFLHYLHLGGEIERDLASQVATPRLYRLETVPVSYTHLRAHETRHDLV